MRRMFQIWASKQVMNVEGVNRNLAKYKLRQSKKCPICNREIETCAHVLACRKEGRVKNLGNSLRLLAGEREMSGENGKHSLG